MGIPKKGISVKTLAKRSGLATAIALGIVLSTAQPTFAWSSGVTYEVPGGCTTGSLAGSSWYPTPTESRASSGRDGYCPVAIATTGKYPWLTAAIRYAAGGAGVPAGTYSNYVTTVGWSHYSYYAGGRHTWGHVVLTT
jgi:hypothetical protein